MIKHKRLLNKFTITITDINGSRHFYLSQIVKKIALYVASFIVFVLIASVLYIKYLDNKVDELTKKEEELLQRSKDLVSKNENMQKSLSEKAEEYASIESKLADFEEQLGLNVDRKLSLTERMDKLNLTNEQQIGVLMQIPNGWPIKNVGISGDYGWRQHPVLSRREFHAGIDLRATEGTPVYAPANGVVEFSGWNNNGYGYTVVLLHNYGFKTVYAHLERRQVVQAGQFVKKGQHIAYSGNTGMSTGPHLHYEVRFINKTLEPLYFMNLTRANMDKFFKQERRIPWQSLINLMSTQASQKQR